MNCDFRRQKKESFVSTVEMELYAYIYFSINDFKLFKILSISPQFDLYDPIMYKVHSTVPSKVRQLHFYLIFIIYVTAYEKISLKK